MSVSGVTGLCGRHRREVEEERFVLGLLFDPTRGLVGEDLHDALVLAAWSVDGEDRFVALGVLHVGGGVGGLEVVRVGNVLVLQSVGEMVFHEDAGEITVICRDAEVVVEPNFERAGGQLAGVIGPPLRGIIGGAIPEVPLADGHRGVAMLLEEGRHVEPGRSQCAAGRRCRGPRASTRCASSSAPSSPSNGWGSRRTRSCSHR